MKQYSPIKYKILIDGKINTLLYVGENKGKYEYENLEVFGTVYFFPQPLATYPLNELFTLNGHSYELISKP